MAYFPNGTSGDIYMEKFCFQCRNWKSREDEDKDNEGCPIIDVHFSVNYTQCRNEKIKRILEILIPTGEDGFPRKCPMYEPNGECKGQMIFEETGK